MMRSILIGACSMTAVVACAVQSRPPSPRAVESAASTFAAAPPTPTTSAAAKPIPKPPVNARHRVLPLEPETRLLGMARAKGRILVATEPANYTEERLVKVRAIEENDASAIGAVVTTHDMGRSSAYATLVTRFGEVWLTSRQSEKATDFLGDDRVVAVRRADAIGVHALWTPAPPKSEFGFGHTAWHTFDPKRAIAAWNAQSYVEFTAEEKAAQRKRQEEAEKRGIAIDFAGKKTTEMRLEASILGGAKGTNVHHVLHRGSRTTTEASHPTLTTSGRGPAIAFWKSGRTEKGPDLDATLEVRWFDWTNGAVLREANVKRPGAADVVTIDYSPIAMREDGVTFVVMNRHAPFERLMATNSVLVQPFSKDGQPLKLFELPLHGMFSGSSQLEVMSCADNIWAIALEATTDFAETIKVFRLSTNGVEQAIDVGTHTSKEPIAGASPKASFRGGGHIFTSCDADRMAVAYEFHDGGQYQKPGFVVLGEWSAK